MVMEAVKANQKRRKDGRCTARIEGRPCQVFVHSLTRVWRKERAHGSEKDEVRRHFVAVLLVRRSLFRSELTLSSAKTFGVALLDDRLSCAVGHSWSNANLKSFGDMEAHLGLEDAWHG